jgi:hypothetical protein
MKAILKFLDQKPVCYETMSFLIKKMIQNKIPEVAKIVKQKRIIEKVLNNSTDNLDMITMCHSYDELKEHVSEVVTNITTERLINLFISLENPNGVDAIKARKCYEYRRINSNILNVLLILISSSGGIDKIKKTAYVPNLFESMSIAVFSGLRTSNTPNEIIFHIKFLISFLYGYVSSKSNIENSIFGSHLPEIMHSSKFKKIPEDLGAEMTRPENAFFEANFSKIVYASDLFLLQAVTLFNFADTLKQPECKLLFTILIRINQDKLMMNKSCC